MKNYTKVLIVIQLLFLGGQILWNECLHSLKIPMLKSQPPFWWGPWEEIRSREWGPLNEVDAQRALSPFHCWWHHKKMTSLNQEVACHLTSSLLTHWSWTCRPLQLLEISFCHSPPTQGLIVCYRSPSWVRPRFCITFASGLHLPAFPQLYIIKWIAFKM